MKKIIPLVFTLLLTDVALACKPVPPHVGMIGPLNAKKSLIVTSANQHYFLKLVPSKWAFEKGRLVRKRDSYGLAFEATPYGQSKPLWSFKHWDVHSGGMMRLSNDGTSLVIVNNYIKSDSDTHAFVAYKNGRKTSEYSASHFGVKISKRASSCLSFSWLDSKTKLSMLSSPFGFLLHTTNGLRWTVSGGGSVIKKAN